MSYIGHQNTEMKRVGVSKLRLMAGASKKCAVCGKELLHDGSPDSDRNHLCSEHSDWELIVVDGPNDEAIRKASIDKLLAHA